jgi:phage tail-like protein
MATGDRKDPLGSSHFVVEIDGIGRAGFQACSGLNSDTAPVTYREGDEPDTVRKLPGLATYTNITLKWGTSDDTDLWKWRQKVVDGKIERKNLSVVLMDSAGTEKVRWNVSHAWPITWTGPSLDAGTSAVAIEQLVIAHEGVKRA